MKRICNRVSLLLTIMLLLCAFGLAGCKNTEAPDLWKNALYTENRELGKGGKTVTAEVEANDKKVVFTVHTDAVTVGAALLENGLIAGDEGPYGLYIKVVNGITADYDIDQTYWSFYIGDEYAISSADATEITEGAVYRLVYTK